MHNQTEFQRELEQLINRYSMEGGSDTPDFILASYLTKCLNNFNDITTQREKWYGREPKSVNDPITEQKARQEMEDLTNNFDDPNRGHSLGSKL